MRAGDRVAYLGRNDIATFETLFAAAQLGAIFVPINTRLAATEIAYLLDDCAPAALVVGAELAGTGLAHGDTTRQVPLRYIPGGRRAQL